MTVLLLAALAHADGDPAQLSAIVNGQEIQLPHEHTDITAWVDGDLASVRLRQTFTNPTNTPLDVHYVFPMPDDAAVHAMVFDVGDRRIEGVIQEKASAQQAFNEAKQAGQQAALVSQQRDNVFVQQLANVPAGATVVVELQYAHEVGRIDGEYEFVVPMVVGPRYHSSLAPELTDPVALPELAWTVGDRAKPPVTLPTGQVSATVHLDGGTEIHGLHSLSHSMVLQHDGQKQATARLPDGPLDNRDLVLRYRLASDAVAVAQNTWAEAGHGVVSLLVEPPTSLATTQITPREMVFVMDCSGSMGGTPMESSKLFMRRSLQKLRPNDTFRLIRFSSRATPFAPEAVPATPENIRAAIRWVDALTTDGGTEMTHGIRAALSPPNEPGRVRNVILLTDGYIGTDVEVVRLATALMGESRMFAFGVGRSVNRWLVEELARVGRGSARVVLDPELAPAAAELLADRLATPVLTDIVVDWGDAPVRDASPERLPDLYAGDRVRVLARFDKPGTYPISVRGRVAGKDAVLPVTLVLPETEPDAAALPIMWARAAVADRMHTYLLPSLDSGERDALRSEVTSLGLEYGLATQWTSWLAIDTRPAPAGPNLSAPHAAPPAWGGHGTPEPGPLLGFGLLALLGLATRRKREE